MSILDFVSEDDLEDLNEDPRLAFMELVNISKKSFSRQISAYDPDTEREWYLLQDVRHNYMNSILAAAKTFGIEPFVSMDVPRRSAMSNDDFTDFKADLDHYITQLMVDSTIRARGDSVPLTSKARDQISSYVNGLRSCIEKSTLSATKRKALLARLDEFEKELLKSRMSYVAMARIVVEILAVPGALWSTGEVVGRLTNNIVQAVAEQRNQELEEKQISPLPPMKALMAPRKVADTRRPWEKKKYDLDDDIPF